MRFFADAILPYVGDSSFGEQLIVRYSVHGPYTARILNLIRLIDDEAGLDIRDWRAEIRAEYSGSDATTQSEGDSGDLGGDSSDVRPDFRNIEREISRRLDSKAFDTHDAQASIRRSQTRRRLLLYLLGAVGSLVAVAAALAFLFFRAEFADLDARNQAQSVEAQKRIAELEARSERLGALNQAELEETRRVVAKLELRSAQLEDRNAVSQVILDQRIDDLRSQFASRIEGAVAQSDTLLRDLRSGTAAEKKDAIRRITATGRTRYAGEIVGILSDPKELMDLREDAVNAVIRLEISDARPVLQKIVVDITTKGSFLQGLSITALGDLGNPKAVDTLLKVLVDSSNTPSYRGAAATSLLKIGDATAVPGLIQALDEGEDDVVGAALTALGGLGGDEAINALIDYLGDSSNDGDLRGAAATSLGTIGDPRAVALLLGLIGKGNPDQVRGTAITSLGEIGDRNATKALLDIVADTTDAAGPRGFAATALRGIGDASAAEGLVAILKDGSQELDLRSAVITTLGNLKSDTSLNALIEVLESDLDRDRDLRGYAATSLGELRDERATTALTALALDPSADADNRGAAITALSGMGPGAVSPLITLLNDADPDLRGAAITALGESGAGDAVQSLLEILGDPAQNTSLRGAAAVALGEIGDIQALEALADVLEDEGAPSIVRLGATIALGDLGTPLAQRILRSRLEIEDDPTVTDAILTVLSNQR